MNNGPMLFLGLFVAMACSWLSFVLGPQLQIGDLRPTTTIVLGSNGQTYPNAEPGTAHQGAEVYRANGCASCHTEQVRPRDLGSDINRGWGVRRKHGIRLSLRSASWSVLGSLQWSALDLANAGRRMDASAILLRTLRNPRYAHARLDYAALPVFI